MLIPRIKKSSWDIEIAIVNCLQVGLIARYPIATPCNKYGKCLDHRML